MKRLFGDAFKFGMLDDVVMSVDAGLATSSVSS
jgi:hypothetical protein